MTTSEKSSVEEKQPPLYLGGTNRVLSYGAGLRPDLDELLAGTPFVGYTYAYPHKTSYRPFPNPVPLADLWAGEERDALFLYIHVPFCEMRCGFCNLFTRARPGQELPESYVQTLEAQAHRVDAALGERQFAHVAFGGGTPTQLSPDLLVRVLDVAEKMGADLRALPVSVETSPETATPERLRLLAERGVDRVSIGIQSFDDKELKALGRPQSIPEAEAALDRIRESFPRLNIDLIYGVTGQSVESWLWSVERALIWRPEEIYLYPLYLRPMTGLGKLGPARQGLRILDQRSAQYRAARDFLLAAGYEQFSMRMFRLPTASSENATNVYRCQEDGMVGLGCGARSYTRALHYSDEWAVGAASVKNILAEWVERPAESFDHAQHGVELDGEEQRRRYLLQSLLNTDGLELSTWRQRFQTEVQDDFPELRMLIERDLAHQSNDKILLTAAGLERSDCIGPWLYSEDVLLRSQDFEVR